MDALGALGRDKSDEYIFVVDKMMIRTQSINRFRTDFGVAIKMYSNTFLGSSPKGSMSCRTQG